MAPEQARGGQVGVAADTWGIGVVLWEAACGDTPFPDESDVYPQLVHRAPPLGSRRRLPAALAGAVDGCLDPDVAGVPRSSSCAPRSSLWRGRAAERHRSLFPAAQRMGRPYGRPITGVPSRLPVSRRCLRRRRTNRRHRPRRRSSGRAPGQHSCCRPRRCRRCRRSSRRRRCCCRHACRRCRACGHRRGCRRDRPSGGRRRCCRPAARCRLCRSPRGCRRAARRRAAGVSWPAAGAVVAARRSPRRCCRRAVVAPGVVTVADGVAVAAGVDAAAGAVGPARAVAVGIVAGVVVDELVAAVVLAQLDRVDERGRSRHRPPPLRSRLRYHPPPPGRRGRALRGVQFRFP